VLAAVNEFGSSSGAVAFLEYQRTKAGGQLRSASTILTSNIPQSFGLLGSMGSTQVGVEAFAYHRWVFDVNELTAARGLDIARIRLLAKRLFDGARSREP
jgi:hypothetical protein